MKYFYAILFSLLSCACLSQTNAWDKKITWDEIIYSAMPVEVNMDSTIIVFTNREIIPESKVFYSNFLNKEDTLRITIATCKNGLWTSFLLPWPDSISKYLEKSASFLYYVHGDGKSYTSNLQACIGLKTKYKVNLIAFDYPSYLPETNGLKNFYNSRKNIKKSLYHFNQYLQFSTGLHTADTSQGNTLMFHSLGNFLYKKHLRKDIKPSTHSVFFDNLVLNSPAVKTGRHRKWVEKSRIQKRIYITSNKNDWTLKGAGLITLSRQLGGNLRKPVAKNAVYINFTEIAGQAHNCFLDPYVIKKDNQAFSFYNEVLNGKEFKTLDEINVIKRTDGLGYDLR